MSGDKITLILRRVTLGLLPFCFGGSYFMYKKMQAGLIAHNYFLQAMTLLRQNPVASGRLGKPIYNTSITLLDKWNCVKQTTAQLKIPVKGSKDKGTLMMWASRPEPDVQGWNVDKLHLVIKNFQPFIIYDPDEESNFDNHEQFELVEQQPEQQ